MSPVITYLRNRGISLPPPSDVRYHPAAPLGYRTAGTRPAMVCALRDRDGNGAGLHVTYLDIERGVKWRSDGSRKMFGPRGACSSAAIRLSEVPQSGILAVAEGVETALSFTELFSTPCWAAASACAVGKFEPPSGIKGVIVAADPGSAGQAAAEALRGRLSRAGLGTFVCTPNRSTADWNDVLRDGLVREINSAEAMIEKFRAEFGAS